MQRGNMDKHYLCKLMLLSITSPSHGIRADTKITWATKCHWNYFSTSILGSVFPMKLAKRDLRQTWERKMRIEYSRQFITMTDGQMEIVTP